MLHEKPNESFHWKNKLDDLDHLPGEQIPDKSQGWEKLHDRLQKKPRYTLTAWFWTAAACLLFISGIPFLMIIGKDNNLAKNDGLSKKKDPQETYAPLADSTSIKPLQIQTSKLGVTTTEVRNKKPDLPNYNTIAIPRPIITQKLSTNFVPEVYNISTNSDTIAFVATVPIKKKLRVIHINDLNKSVEEQIQLSRKSTTPVFQINPLNQDVFSAFAISKNASDNIVRIKLSTN